MEAMLLLAIFFALVCLLLQWFDMEQKQKVRFGSRFGMIAAIGGSVVGLGNIWRFPYLVGENGGSAFIIVYVLISFLIAVPVLICEVALGRSTRGNAVVAFKKASGRSQWGYVGMLGVVASASFLAFYSVISGWSLEFIRMSVVGGFQSRTPDEISSYLNEFINSGWRPVMWTIIFVVLSSLIVIRGVDKGVEKFAKTVTPLIVVILVVLVINSFTLDGFRRGVEFLFAPDMSKISVKVALYALGQAFFSLSLGLGALITYGAYVSRQTNIVATGGIIAVADLLVALLSGLAIFPAVFTYGVSPESGPRLVFATLPNVFAQMNGGYVLSIIFFVLLFFAAITSSISLIETVAAYVRDRLRISRKASVVLVMLSTITLGSMCALSQVEGSDLTVLGVTLFDVSDVVTSNYLLPVSAFLLVLFVGWFDRKGFFKGEVTNDGKRNKLIYYPIFFFVKFIVPLFIVLLFLSLSGVLKL